MKLYKSCDKNGKSGGAQTEIPMVTSHCAFEFGFQNILRYCMCIGRMEGEGCGVEGGQKNTQLGRRRKSALPVPEC